MGVLACDRRGCYEIMCDTCIDGRWYICPDCKNEFKEYIQKKDIHASTEGEFKIALGVFMDTEKGEFEKGDDMNVDEFFNKYTRE